MYTHIYIHTQVRPSWIQNIRKAASPEALQRAILQFKGFVAPHASAPRTQAQTQVKNSYRLCCVCECECVCECVCVCVSVCVCQAQTQVGNSYRLCL